MSTVVHTNPLHRLVADYLDTCGVDHGYRYTTAWFHAGGRTIKVTIEDQELVESVAAEAPEYGKPRQSLGRPRLALGDVGWRAHVLALRLEQRLPLRGPAQNIRATTRRYRVRRRVVDIARRWAVRA